MNATLAFLVGCLVGALLNLWLLVLVLRWDEAREDEALRGMRPTWDVEERP